MGEGLSTEQVSLVIGGSVRDGNGQSQTILEERERTNGRSAHRMNIAAAKLVCETVRTTLGPKGMDKMLVDAAGEVVVTNDGVTILEEMELLHPCAKMLVEIARTQEREIGDGTTTAVVLAGSLLGRAEGLLEKGVHPTVIAKGYRVAAIAADEILQKIAKPIVLDNTEMILQLAATAMTGKGVEQERELLASIVYEAISTIGKQSVLDRDAVTIVAKPGGSLADTRLINGIILDAALLTTGMPRECIDAKILLLDTPLEIRSTEIDAKISITSPQQLEQFMHAEEALLERMVERVAASGASVVLSQRGIDEYAAHALAKRGIMACRRVKKADMVRLERATGAQTVRTLEDFPQSALGKATVQEQRVGAENLLFVRNCPAARAVSVLVRGSTEHVIAEAKRALEDAIGDTVAALSRGKVVPGAGAAELEIAKNLRLYASKLSGREQLAVQAFADALEVLPRTLAENAGIDPIDALAALHSAHESGMCSAGIDVFTGETMDSWKVGVIEPLSVKTQALASAVEVAVMILRIDDVIAARETPRSEE